MTDDRGDRPGDTERGVETPLRPAVPSVVTVPLATTPLRSAHRQPTQVSPSAVPSTLESPGGAGRLRAQPDTRIQIRDEASSPATLDDVNLESTLPDDTARDAAIREASKRADAQVAAMQQTASKPSSPRHGPPTMMSRSPGADSRPPPARSAESAVVDAILPAAAYAPPPSAAETLDMSPGPGAHGQSGPPPGYPQGAMPQAQAAWVAPAAHAAHAGPFDGREHWQPGPAGHDGQGAPFAVPGLDRQPARTGEAPRSSGTLIVVGIVGAAVLLVVVAAVAGGAYLVSERKVPAQAAQTTPPAEATTPPSTPAPASAPDAAPTPAARDPRLMSGTKARLSTLSAGSLDGEAVRAAITLVLPKVDVCYAANDLEPPNHETAAYDLDVTASGAVTRVEPQTTAGRAAKLDVCVGVALRTAKMPKAQGATKVKLTLSSRIGDR